MARLMEDLREIVEAKKAEMPNAESEFLVESAGIDDFAMILGSQMNRTLQSAYRDVPMPWRSYCRVSTVSDFRDYNRIMGSDAEDLLDLGRGGAGPFQDSKLTEQFYKIHASTKARMFSVTRAALINDDLNFLSQQPTRFGRSAARTLTKDVAINTLEANLNAYDGTALFHTNHSNLLSGGTSTLTAANLQTARMAISRAKFEGQYMGLTATKLVIPPELEATARAILNSDWIPQPGTGIGNFNFLQGALELVIDPWLTSTTAWYVFADPADAPAIEVAFLNGKDSPDLLVQRPDYRLVAGGGDDTFLHGELDELRYAVRYDYGIATAMYQGAFKSVGA